MKLKGSINRLKGVEANVGNAISFLQVQDGILESAGKIVDRMAELKALSQDVLKNTSDIANYNSEFANLQLQLRDMANTKFNGVSLFGTGVAFGSDNTNKKSIVTSADGTVNVSINQSQLLSALTIDTNGATSGTSLGSTTFANAAGNANVFTFASATTSDAISLGAIDANVYTKALENIATLRSENGASVSRLMFSEEAATQRRTNLEAAHGRIMDVDIAAESTALAKYSILVQASASMLAQANQSSSIALQLLG
jgi:flagellin